eukprot:4755410-Pleurochrysis_carterae.AAC.3
MSSLYALFFSLRQDEHRCQRPRLSAAHAAALPRPPPSPPSPPSPPPLKAQTVISAAAAAATKLTQTATAQPPCADSTVALTNRNPDIYCCVGEVEWCERA